MEDNIAKIKERVDVVDLISGYMKLQKAGLNFKACCPFHNEKTPSFYVSPERQIWHCFGCGLGGSIFDFVIQTESVDFPEALRILARKAGIELTSFDREFQNDRAKLLEICERSAKFFEKQLWESNTGKKALEYLKGRGVSDGSIKSFRLGFSPDSWDSLFTFLKNSGHSAPDIEKAGLILKKEQGRDYYDRFRSRIIFPISDLNEQVVGFTGRIFPAKSAVPASGAEIVRAKYINTPQTILYDKSRILYGLDKAKKDVKKKNSCLVVEGNMDVIMSHQAGAVNAVASSGTALTDQHLGLVKRYTQNINLCFDKDSAGQMATDRGVGLALARGFNIGVVSIDDPECKDPADYVQKYGAKWEDQVSKKKSVAEFYFDQAFQVYSTDTIEGKKSIIAKLLPLVKSMSNAIEQSHWLEELSMRLKVKENDLRVELTKTAPLTNQSIAVDTEIDLSSSKNLQYLSKDILEDYAVSLILKQPLWYKDNHKKINEEFFSETACLILNKIKDYNYPEIKPAELINSLDENSRKKFEIWYLQSQAQWTDMEDNDFEKEISKILFYLKKRQISSKLASLEQEMRQAEKNKNNEKVALLIQEFTKLSQEISKNI